MEDDLKPDIEIGVACAVVNVLPDAHDARNHCHQDGCASGIARKIVLLTVTTTSRRGRVMGIAEPNELLPQARR